MPYDHPTQALTPQKSIFDWERPVNYDQTRKAAFHRAARQQLKALASYCGWPPGTYDIRSNMAGIAVSGEITLHHEQVYVSVSQARLGADSGILIRSCKGRKDYTGGMNNFASINLLNDIPGLAHQIQRLIPSSVAGGSR